MKPPAGDDPKSASAPAGTPTPERERWERLKQLFEGALRRDPASRAAYLDATCGADRELREEVESLLAAHDQADSFFEDASLSPTATGSGSPAESAGALAGGTRLGPYEILAFLNAGGMGEVYRARDTRLGREVAVKLLLPRLSRDSERVRRFEREARSASALNHPNILTVHDFGTHGSAQYIVTELIRGVTLRERLSQGPLPAAELLSVAVQLAAGLAKAHEAGIVHRDLKPENVMLTEDGLVKILDFGLATLKQAAAGEVDAETRTRTHTRSGVVLGTVGYMSPEQARTGPTDFRSDQFLFGAVLYEMATGRRAFSRATPVDSLFAILHEQPEPVARLNPGLPEGLQAIMERCLAKDPSQRYASTRELLHALQSLEARRVEGRLLGMARLARRPRLALALAALALALVVAGAVVAVRAVTEKSERKAAVAEVEHLVDLGRFVDVWRVGRAALQRWPSDPALDSAIRATSHLVTISTEPPGAEVAFKAYEDVDGEWLSLGTTPLKEVRAPLGQLRWRIMKNGFEPLEARLEVGAPAAAAGRPDVDARPIRLRPVGSDVGRMVFVPGGSQGGVELADYWIDQTEVTNREFKDFIDKGGYQDTQHWTYLGRERPQVVGREGAGAAFRDRTGRPGPSTWELGTYPEGKGDYPVNGVGWFEAVAYCRSNGKSLPTVFHWRKAFGASYFVEVLTLGNFTGRGPEATGQLKEVGPYGTLGMAGNVKEWVWNEFEGQRYILGGAWNEPVYMATYDDVRPPLDRAETHGFRCVKESTPSEAAAYGPYGAGSRPARDFTKEKPVGAAEFEIIRRFYSYDQTPLDPRIERTEEAEHWRRERVSFAAAYGGERVLANILLPKNVAPPYQTVIWFPGGYALQLKSSDRDLVFSYYFDFLPRSGRALVYPVYKGTYERQAPGGFRESQRRDLVVQWSKDLGRTIDYLESRGDFDRGKIAYYGFSMGADAALPALALEPRVKAAVLLTGGFSTNVRPPEVEPLNFVPRIRVPVLLLGGRNDFSRPVETSQAPLFERLGTPAEHKRHVVFEGAGHVPPRIGVIREILDWLDRYLGPVGGRLTHATPPSPP